jgi:hypothetical protein
LTHYFLALAVTIAVEVLVLAALTKNPERKRVLTACVLVNCLTHPLAWTLSSGGLPLFAFVELAVVAAEAWLYAAVVPARFGRALFWSVAANVPTILLSFWL